MDPILALIVLATTLAVVAVVAGGVLNIRSVRAGAGLSRTGTRIGLLVVGSFQLITAAFLAYGTIRAGAWPLLVLALPFIAFGLAFIRGAIRLR
jgi:hypothetical protein